MPKKSAKKRRGSKILVAEEGAAAELAAGQPEPELGAAASVGGSTGKRRGDSSVEVVHGAEDEEELVFEGDVESPDEEEIIDGEADGGSAEAMDSVAELEQAVRAWRPGVDKLDDGEELQFDNKSYTMFHRMRMEWPCLSFDFARDGLGDGRTAFPMSVYAVAGTQAEQASQNKLLVMKLSHMQRTEKDSDSEADTDEEEEDGEEDAIMEHREIEHPGGVNRVRCQPQSSNIVASWADSGRVHIWDVESQLAILDGPLPLGSSAPKRDMAPLQTFAGHRAEGFALDWSSVQAGRLASGDCEGAIHIWEPAEAGWKIGGAGVGHDGSVEDLQWSPSESKVVASCGVDGSVVVWDARAKMKPGARINRAHASDVNVISWNALVSYLLVSGGDDGTFRIWDLRTLKSSGEAPEAAAMFKHHNAPITSIEWCPTDRSVLAVTGDDDQTTVWDMSVERDEEEEEAAALAGVADIPSQLLFVHMGQSDVKEVHWHPQLTNVLATTAGDGFNVFKPSNL